MVKGRPIDVQKTLETLYNAERTFRGKLRAFHQVPKYKLIDVLAEHVQQALQVTQPRERDARLMTLIRVLADIRGPRAIDLIIDILGCDSEEANRRASQVLEDLADERLSDLRDAISRAIKRLPSGHVALSELPFVVYNLRDVDRISLLRPFLDLQDPEPVAATIEAFIEIMDPSVKSLLEPFVDDNRVVLIDEGPGEDPEQLTVGQIASEAIQSLEEVERALDSSRE